MSANIFGSTQVVVDGDCGNGERLRAFSATPLGDRPFEAAQPSEYTSSISRELDYDSGFLTNVAYHRTSFPTARTGVIFIPGVGGGAGPCRSPLERYDPEALFPKVAEHLSQRFPMDCYRVMWMVRSPVELRATQAVCRLVYRALIAARGPSSTSTCRILLIGHSFGGSVALRAAAKLKKEFLAGCAAEMAGVVALAAQTGGALETIGSLTGVPKLICHGIDDDCLAASGSLELYQAAPEPKELLLLKCGHNFFDCKTKLLRVLCEWAEENGLPSDGSADGALSEAPLQGSTDPLGRPRNLVIRRYSSDAGRQ